MTPSGPLLTRYYETDRSFHEKGTPNQVLCLQASPASLALALYDPQKERFVALGDWAATHPGRMPYADGGAEAFGWFFGEVLREVPLLSNTFGEVRISWEGPSATLVPDEFYQEQERETFLSILARSADGDKVLASRMKGYGIWDLFAIPAQVRDSLDAAFRKPSICHISAPLAEGIGYETGPDSASGAVLLNIRDHWFDLLITKEHGLVHCTLFPWQEPADVAYYLVYTLEQLRIDISRVPVRMTGRVSAGDDLFRLLYRYVTHLSLYPTPTGNLSSDLPGKAPYHAWFAVLSLLRCGS